MLITACSAIVTGAASGLGEATARALAAAGARVALFDLNQARVEQVAKEIGGLGIACDVSNPEQAAQAIERVTKEQGAARICINCAGIGPAQRIVGRDGIMPLEAFAQVVNVNLVGTFNMLRLVAGAASKLDPIGPSGERGIIINTASVAAYEGQVGQAAYSASKGGVVSLTVPAARELSQFGIRVLGIAPGLILTPMLLGMPEEVQQSLADNVPFPKRLGEPAEYARLAMHMIENEYLNGEVIRLDGGIRLQAR